jgi:small-conductance mechanosensitive channel
MRRGRLLAESVHLLALGTWLGGLGVAGFAAGRIFRAMRELDTQLPGYAGFEGAHWSIAGGRAVLPLFFAVDVVQFFCVLLAGTTFALATGFLGLSLRRISTFLRAFFLLGLIALLSYRFFVIQGPMMQSLVDYWNAAAAGETTRALANKDVFDRAHVLDRRLMMVTMLMVLGAIVAAVWSLLAGGERTGLARPSTELEVPLLAR